jgi:hypothetical protein
MASVVAKPALELINESDLQKVNLDKGGSQIQKLARLPDTLSNKLEKAKDILAGESHILSSEKYPTVYITSDIHADLRKFIQLLIGAGMITYKDINGNDISKNLIHH